MAFPIVEATNTSEETVATTSHDVALPASIQAGELLLAILDGSGAIFASAPAGWVRQASLASVAIGRSPATGGEGASVTVTSTGSGISTHNSYRISGQHGDFAIAGSVVSTPNLTPPWGSDDNLWIAAIFARGTAADIDVTAAPAGYTDLIKSDVVTNGTHFFRTASAWRQLAAGSENPGNFTLSGTSAILLAACTIAVRPVPPQVLTPSLYSDPDIFPTPRVDLDLAAALYSDPDAFYTASLTAERLLVAVPAPGAATLNPVADPGSATLSDVSAPTAATLNPVT